MARLAKHARPRAGKPRPRVVTAIRLLAGLVGSAALLAPITPAAAAMKRDGVNWDAIAHCESSGNWRANTGNGYYGGLQFSSRTWRGHGGGKYARTANRATRSEQITVARRVLRSQGIGAWPTCGRKASSSKRYVPRHATEPVRRPDPALLARKAPRATMDAVPSRTTRPAKARTTGVYVVRSGDTLARIATSKRVAGGWKQLYRLNRGTLHSPNRIYPGQRLML